jgi:hypothetical protein
MALKNFTAKYLRFQLKIERTRYAKKAAASKSNGNPMGQPWPSPPSQTTGLMAQIWSYQRIQGILLILILIVILTF